MKLTRSNKRKIADDVRRESVGNNLYSLGQTFLYVSSNKYFQIQFEKTNWNSKYVHPNFLLKLDTYFGQENIGGQILPPIAEDFD